MLIILFTIIICSNCSKAAKVAFDTDKLSPILPSIFFSCSFNSHRSELIFSMSSLKMQRRRCFSRWLDVSICNNSNLMFTESIVRFSFSVSCVADFNVSCSLILLIISSDVVRTRSKDSIIDVFNISSLFNELSTSISFVELDARSTSCFASSILYSILNEQKIIYIF